MSRDKQRLADFLAHILEAIERIECYTDGMDDAVFLGNQMAQDAVIRNLEIIGEASNNIEKLYPEFAAAHPELPLASCLPGFVPCCPALSAVLGMSPALSQIRQIE